MDREIIVAGLALVGSLSGTYFANRRATALIAYRLEQLGGGGNSTTAGGQAKGITVAEAKEKLLAAIDQYFED